ncbi:MAG: serine/threonine-protein kinase [Planctomycetota bacterium]
MSRLPTVECPSREVLLAYLQEDVDDLAQIDAHVQECSICQERLSAACDGQTIDRWRQIDEQSLASEHGSVEAARTTISPNNRDTDIEAQRGDAGDPATTPRIPGYVHLEEIARGGMGIVYRARDRKLKRLVALKVLPRDSAVHPDRWLRFRTEAEAAARLQHDNVIRVYDADSHEGLAYVSQELADRRSLADRIEQTPQNPRRSAELLSQLAQGVQHAHDHGVLHRDLKPSNVLFVGEVPKVADFGIAKLLDAPSELTQTQAIIGTPDYMAPEQASGDGEQVGFATDVYALGVILYEMLTGVRPFRGETSLEIIRQVIEHDPIAPRKLNASIPKDLETICLKCLQKQVGNRYSTPTTLAEDLNRFLDGRPILAKPATIVQHGWKWIRRHPAWSSLAAVVFISAVSLVVVWARFTHALSIQTKLAQDKATEAETRLSAQLESNEATKEVVEFLTVDLFDAAIPENEGIGLTVLNVLDSAGESIDRRFSGRPRVEAALRAAIGNTYYETGHGDQALEHLERAVSIYRELGDRGDAELSQDAKLSLAMCLKSLGQPERSRELLNQLSREKATSDELRLAVRYAQLNARDGNEPLAPDDSEMLQLYDDCSSRLGSTHTQTLSVLGTIAVAYFRAGDFERAAELFREQRQDLIDAVGNIHPDTVIANNNLAISYIRLNRYDEAEALHRENCEFKVECLGPDHYMTLKAYHHLAMVVWRQGRQDEATQILEQVIRDRMRVLGPKSTVLDSLFQIGRMYQEMQRPELGTAVFHEVIAPVWDERETNSKWLDLAQVYGAMLHQSGDIDRARELRDTAVEMLKVGKLANKYRRGVQQDFEDMFVDGS